MRKGADALRADGFHGEVKILTSCPSCQQGLSRYNDDSGTTADYIVVEMAKHLLGENWLADYVAKANNGGIERVLVYKQRGDVLVAPLVCPPPDPGRSVTGTCKCR